MKQQGWLVNTLVTAILCSSVIYGGAQYEDDDYAPSSLESPPDLKRPSFFHRPHMKTASEQLSYADGLLASEKRRKAGKQYLALVHEWHQSSEAPRAQLQYAKVLYDRGKYKKAFDELQYLIDNFAGAFSYGESLALQLRIANHTMTDKKWDILFFSGFTRPEQALPMFEQITDNAPNWSQTPDIRLNVGMINEEIGKYAEAAAAYEAVEIHHPRTDQSRNAAFRKACCLAVLSDKSPRDEKRCRAALSAFASFLATYAGGTNSEEAERRIGNLKLRLENMYFARAHFYDRVAKRPESAIIAYVDFLKQFPSSEKALDANARLEELEQQMRQSNDD